MLPGAWAAWKSALLNWKEVATSPRGYHRAHHSSTDSAALGQRPNLCHFPPAMSDDPPNPALLPAGLRDMLPPDAETDASAVEARMGVFAFLRFPHRLG